MPRFARVRVPTSGLLLLDWAAMDGAELITQLWTCIDRRDWRGLGETLHEDVTLEYPVTGEAFRGRATVVAINAQYPEGWSIQVLRVIADGEDVVSEVEVPMAGVGVFRVASFWTVRSDHVVHAREYWTSLQAEEGPTWRRPYRDPA
ncbi:nuclear transport factor 2 family protein [Microlunatus lacustris]